VTGLFVVLNYFFLRVSSCIARGVGVG